METPFNERIRKVFKKSNLTRNELTKLLGVSDMTQRRWETGEHSLRHDHIEKIARAFPEISLEWLILGIGSMYKTEADILNKDRAPYGNVTKENLYIDRINELKAALEHCYAEIDHLRFMNREIINTKSK